MHLRKNSFFIHSPRVLLLFFLICTAPLYAAIYSRPRRVFVIQTEYFEYIFPRGAEQTACYLAKNGDALFEKAAEQGHPDAQCNCGTFYFNGQGAPRDLEKARFWFEKAAAQGDAFARQVLAEHFPEGK